jgi:hypothetical protein
MTMQENLKDFIKLIEEAKKFVNLIISAMKNVCFIMMMFPILVFLKLRRLIGKDCD